MKNLKNFLALALVVCASMALSPRAFGQATDGNITGTVTDATGAAVPGASVEAENAATGVKTTATSNRQGEYRVENLLVGTYKLSVSAPGFAPTAVDHVSVTLNLTTTINVALTVGNVSSAVQVTEAGCGDRHYDRAGAEFL
jgi:hypothetical protein